MDSSGGKKRKALSKKSKKSWRKTDVQDVEDFLDDQRLEERLGGKFSERKDEELFAVDDRPSAGDEGDGVQVTTSRRADRKKGKPLRCWKNLEVTGGAKDPKKGRNTRKAPEQRLRPALRAVKKQKAALKAKEKVSRHVKSEASKKSNQKERAARRRTKFDFDLWGNDEGESELKENEWLEKATKTVNLTGTGKLKPKQPSTLRKKTSELSAVEAPHGGESYNPSLSDHQDLLWRAAVKEMEKEKVKQRDEYHTTRMFPDRKSAPTEESRLMELSAGLMEESESSGGSGEEEEEERPSGGGGGGAKPKTRKQRRKEKEQKKVKRVSDARRKANVQTRDLMRVKSLRKQVKVLEEKAADSSKKKLAKKALKMRMPAVLGKRRFEEQDIDLKLSDELTGNLRTLKPEGNLLVDRFKSLQKRNIIETREKHKVVRNRRKRKRVEKRSHKAVSA